MNKWNFSLIVFVFLGFTIGTAKASNSLSEVAESALNTEIELHGSSSIIVEYKGMGSIASLSGQARKTFVRSMHNRFKSSLSSSMASKVSSSFSYVPGAVLSVDKKQLQEIRNNPFVNRVYQNKARRISLQESLDIVLPGSSKDQFSGKGQTIAILDTGVDINHSFFRTNGTSRIVSEACYSGGGLTRFREVTPLCPNRSIAQIGVGAGRDCTNLNFPGCDHGTHVAGIAAGNDGVANEASIIAVQVFTGLSDVFRVDLCGTGVGQTCVVAFDSDIIQGLERVFALRNTFNIAAVNMSLGGGQNFGSCDSQNSIMTNIIGQLKQAGIATVIASGNSGFSSSIGFPACISNAIAVGATSDFTGVIAGRSVTKDQRVFYSNHSATVDLLAPGTLIRSSVPGGRFENFNGTSMAAPHVSAGFAVVKAEGNSLTVDTIENAFKSSGPNVSAFGVSRRRIDIAAALRKLGLSGNPSIAAVMLLLLSDDSPAPPPTLAEEPPAGL